jgi:hypothetical protein
LLGLMTSAPSDKVAHATGLLRCIACATLVLFLSACGANKVIVEGEFPTPVMTPLPLNIGVWYPDEFRNHEFTDMAKTPQDSSWVVKTGDAQTTMWNVLLAGMFESVVEMEAAPVAGAMNRVVDAVLIPEIDELQYAIPTQTHVKVYEIWMRYRFKLVDLDGEIIAEWMMTAYGKTPTAFLRSNTAAVNMAAVMALRDAGANFVINFSKTPELADWLANMSTRAEEVAP